jgi:hypothetical protein
MKAMKVLEPDHAMKALKSMKAMKAMKIVASAKKVPKSQRRLLKYPEVTWRRMYSIDPVAGPKLHPHPKLFGW